MAKVITVYWRDIPAQVIGRAGRERIRRALPQRFADAIDTAAMRAGRGGSDEYLADWRRASRPCDGDLQEVVEAEAARLEDTFDDEALRQLVHNDGVAGP